MDRDGKGRGVKKEEGMGSRPLIGSIYFWVVSYENEREHKNRNGEGEVMK